MNEDETLRQLLGELAGSPPQTAGRKEAVMSRVHRRVQRQLAVRGVATFATVALLALGGVTTSQTLMRTGADGHAAMAVASTFEMLIDMLIAVLSHLCTPAEFFV